MNIGKKSPTLFNKTEHELQNLLNIPPQGSKLTRIDSEKMKVK